MGFIKISDVTLCEIQKSNLSLSFKEKLEIAKKLDELNVDFIELPYSESKSDEVLIKTLLTCLTNSTLAYCIDCDENKLNKANSLLDNAKNKRLVINLPVSADKMEYAFNVKSSKLFDIYLSLIEKAVKNFDTEISLDDATRADSTFLYSLMNKIIELGVSSVTICDKTGAIEPNDFKDFIDGIYKNVNGIDKVSLFVECFDDMSMATSSIFNSFNSGVTGVKLSSLNTSLLPNFEKFFSALNNIGGKKGITTSINSTCIHRVISQIANISSAKKESVVVNNDIKIEKLDKNLSVNKFSELLKNRGYDLSMEDTIKVLDEIKRIGEKKELTTKDLDSIVAVTALQVPATYLLKSYAVHCSNVISSSANITLECDGKDVCGIAIGNGSVDSAFLAIQNALGRKFDLEEFVVNGVTEGQQAMGETIIKLRNNGKIYSGRGVSTDIVGASIRAYINALNKIVYEEKE